MRRPLLIAAAAAVIALFGAPPAFAQPSGSEGTGEVAPVETQDEAPAPVDAPADPAPVDTPAPDPVDTPVVADPPTVAPDPVDTPAEPPATPSGIAPPGTVTPGPTGTGAPSPTDSATASATASPTDTSTTSPTLAPTTTINDIDVDINIDDHSDHSIHIDNSVKILVEGDRYSSVYVYRDRDGKTYRGWDLDCTDFDTQADAQAFLDAVGTDIYWLDADSDGIACEAGSGEFTRDTAAKVGVRRGGQVNVYPAGAVATGRAA